MPTHSQNQVSNSENLPSSFIPTDSQDNSFLTVPQQSSGSIVLLPSGVDALSGPGYFSYPPGALNAFSPECYVTPMHPQPASTYTQTNPQPDSLEFFFQPPDEFCHYRIHCKGISYETIECLLNNSLDGFNNVQFNENENEYNFFYRQQYNDRFYQISCRIVSPEFINHYLNKNIFGIEIEKDMGVMGREQVAFVLDQKKNLEFYLRQHLSQCLLI